MKKDNGTHRIRKGILAVFMNLILIIFSLSCIFPMIWMPVSYTHLAQGARLHAEIKEVPVGCRQNQQLQTETAVLEYEDTDHPYLQGAVGVSVRNGSHAKYSSIRMRCDS